MIVYINNKEHHFDTGITIAEALKLIDGIPSTGIALALNNDVIPAQQWNEKQLANGDRITIIKAFYGG